MPAQQWGSIELCDPQLCSEKVDGHTSYDPTLQGDGTSPSIQGIAGILVDPAGFVIMNVRVPCVRVYNEDQIAVILDDPEMEKCPVILGTPTLYRVMEVIKESEISQLEIPWATSHGSWLM